MTSRDKGSITSLYVCDFPQTLDRIDLSKHFTKFDGFVACRLAKDKTGQKICFVDLTSHKFAQYAKDKMQGYKFAGQTTRGLNIRISDNSKQ